jgi:phage-related minor tail protein
MANHQNAATLGVALSLNTGDFVTEAQKVAYETQKMKNSIAREMRAADKEIQALQYATEDYGKTVSKVTQLEREMATGRLKNLNKSEGGKEKAAQLLAQAAAYDKMAAAAKNAAGAQFKMNEQQKIQLTYQTTDLVTQIASGQSPFIAILQQGGQLKDVMGGVGNAFRAVGSLITPFTVGMTAAAGSVAAVAYAFINADRESAAFRDNMILTGRYAGVTQSQVSALSQTLGTDLNVGFSKANDVILSLVGSGKFTYATIDDLSKLILRFSKLSGVDAAEATQKLMGAFDGTAASVRSLNSQYNFLTVEQYKQIVAYEKAGKAQEAIRLGVKAFSESIDGQVRELGTLEKAWKAVGEAVTYVKDAILGIGRKSDQDDLMKLAKDIERITSDIGGTDTFSIANRATNKKLLQEKMADYLALAKKMNDDVVQAQIASDKKVADQKKIQDLAKYEGLYKSKPFELEKAIIEARFAAQKAGMTEIAAIELEGAKKREDALLEMRQKNLAEDNRASEQNLKIFQQKEIVIATETAEKVRQARFKILLAEYNEQQKVKEELALFEAQEDIKRQNIRIASVDRTREMTFLKDQLEMRNKMMFATEKEQRLAQLSLEYARKRREVEKVGGPDKQFNLDQIDRQEQMARLFVDIETAMMRTQRVFDSVWNNMGSAIDNFVKTGKLNMKDFARSVIQDLIAMEMKLQAMALLRGLFSQFVTARAYGTNIGSEQTRMLSAQDAGFRANGGPVSANSPYIVGEKGPEMFIPSGSGTIIPNHSMGMASTTNVTNNYINAIDTKSFEDRLLGSSNAIWAANQYAGKNLATNFGRT